MNVENNGDWDEYRRLILSNQRELKGRLDAIEVRLRAIEIAVAVSRTKLAMWGGVGGAAAGAALTMIVRLFGPA